jgi:hypothetical protein
MEKKVRRMVVLGALALALAACGSGGPPGGDRSQVGAPAEISHIHGLGVDAQGTLYVATHFGLIERAPDGSFVYASADRYDTMGFSLHPADGIMYRSGHAPPSRPSLGVESSRDGTAWTHLADVASPPVDFHAMAVSFADSKTLWGWDSGGRGLFRSRDGGRTWTLLQAPDRLVYALSGPAEPNVVLAGAPSGMYRSRDSGTTWEAVPETAGGWVIGIAADPKDPKHLLASMQSGVKASRDGGATWKAADGGLPEGVEILHLAISPTDENVAYAADASTIYRTTDGGKAWTVIHPT